MSGEVISIETARQNPARAALDTATAEVMPLDVLIARYCEAVLHAFEGNKTRAAKALGIDRRSLGRYLSKVA